MEEKARLLFPLPNPYPPGTVENEVWIWGHHAEGLGLYYYASPLRRALDEILRLSALLPPAPPESSGQPEPR